jgi:phosphohistidine phosphatase SixA
MKVYLIHHATAFSLEEDPERHLTEQGRAQADRLGARFAAAGVDPARILHSDKQWVKETAQRIAAAMDLSDRTAVAGYEINTGDDLAPFLADIKAGDGDLMMVGHVEFLRRAAAKLVTGDESAQVIAFKPDFGTAFCLEDEEGDWIVRFGWRQEYLAD